ncbi:MAG: PQQ-dependent sugar dehydrogenase [Gemmatimonadota bacterium]
MRRRTLRFGSSAAALAVVGALAACGMETAASAPACDPDDGGLVLPEGFCAAVVADGVGPVRHLAVAPDGDIYAAVRDRRGEPGGVLALRDTTGDGRADVTARFGPQGGTGIALVGEDLFFATDDAILRYDRPAGSLEPAGGPDTIAAGLLNRRSHAAKSIAVGDDGRLFVNIGAPSNACQEEARQPGVPGTDPCPLLEESGGIWAFDAGRSGQAQADGERWATGIRNMVALAVDPPTGRLYGLQHGRDQLNGLWPDLYTDEESSELPAEEFFRIDRGDDFGWPYCYYDHLQARKVLMPEYGGDGEEVGRCAEKEDPVVAFPGHWAPNALVFYHGDAFPERYRGGAFVAFHGSWNRTPVQQGYRVSFVPFRNGAPSGEYETFADGFTDGEVASAGDAEHRPTGLAVGPDGSLYITDDAGGRIWRVAYVGR